MKPDDPTHAAIREGEPPYRSGDIAGEASTSNPANPVATHPAMLILVWFLRVVAVLLAGWATLGIFFAMMFRMEGSDELEMIKQVDLRLGGVFALAVVLFFVPGRLRKPMHCLLILGVAALAWFCITGYLISSHEWQHEFRSRR